MRWTLIVVLLLLTACGQQGYQFDRPPTAARSAPVARSFAQMDLRAGEKVFLPLQAGGMYQPPASFTVQLLPVKVTPTKTRYVFVPVNADGVAWCPGRYRCPPSEAAERLDADGLLIQLARDQAQVDLQRRGSNLPSY